MERQEITGSLASGGTFRATPTLLEIMTPTGEVAATFDTRYFETVHRDGQALSISRIGNSDINVTAASLSDAEALEQVLQFGVASPTPGQPAAAAPVPPVSEQTPAAASDGGMNSLLKWGCIGTLALIGLAAVCLILGLVVFRDSGDSNDTGAVSTVTPPAAIAVEPTATVGTVPDATPEGDATAAADAATQVAGEPTTPGEPDATATEAVATSPDPTATSEPAPPAEPGAPGTSRDNPFPFGEVAQTDEWEIQILEVVRGDEAYDILLETNMFNDPPPPGYEFVLVNLTARYTGESEESKDIDTFWLRSTGDSGVKHYNVFPVNPEPNFRATLFTGGEVTGWATVMAREDDSNLLLIFEDWLSWDNEGVFYLALEEGAQVELSSGRLAEENDLGFSINDPAPFGERIVGENWEIWVIETVRGQAALDMVMEANQFNDEPDEGMEYVLVHVGARNIGTSTEVQYMGMFSFQITGDAARVYDSAFVIDPEPRLDYEMYPGGEATGWITLQVSEGEQNLLLIYEPWLSFTSDPRYLALE
jgi:hypothetical protein